METVLLIFWEYRLDTEDIRPANAAHQVLKALQNRPRAPDRSNDGE